MHARCANQLYTVRIYFRKSPNQTDYLSLYLSLYCYVFMVWSSVGLYIHVYRTRGICVDIYMARVSSYLLLNIPLGHAHNRFLYYYFSDCIWYGMADVWLMTCVILSRPSLAPLYVHGGIRHYEGPLCHLNSQV